MFGRDNQKQLPSWDALWVNARLATMNGPGFGIIEDGAMAVHQGRIAWVGARKSLPGKPDQLSHRVHDAKGAWITPGLIDCHTHLVYAGNRAQEFEQRMQGKSYADIAKAGGGILSTVRATREATAEELLNESAPRLATLVEQGVTTVEIKSGYGLDLESELKMLRVARMLGEQFPVTVQTSFLGAHTIPPEFTGRSDAYIEYLIEEILPAAVEEGLVDAVDAYCEKIAFSPEQVRRLFDAAKERGLPVRLHAEQLSDSGGAALAAGYRALCADHLEHLTETGVKAMAASGTVAVLLPAAFYCLRDTVKPPIELLRKYKVPMAVSTDCNPGTSPTTSLLLTLNMACVLFGLTPEEALLGATRHAAQALGLANQIGTLEPGKAADFALWDVTHPSELSYHIGLNPCIGSHRAGFAALHVE